MNLHPWCFSAWQSSRSLQYWRGSLFSFELFPRSARHTVEASLSFTPTRKPRFPQAGFSLSRAASTHRSFQAPFWLDHFFPMQQPRYGQGFEEAQLPKTLVEFRAQNLRLLEQLCPDDPGYIQTWIRKFDQQNGIEPEAAAKPRRERGVASPKKARSSDRTN
jgi:hypothetical protein